MNVLGYTYSNGDVLCAEHATNTTDEGNESGQAFAVYSWHEAHYDLLCDVDGKIILAQNSEDE